MLNTGEISGRPRPLLYWTLNRNICLSCHWAQLFICSQLVAMWLEWNISLVCMQACESACVSSVSKQRQHVRGAVLHFTSLKGQVHRDTDWGTLAVQDARTHSMGRYSSGGALSSSGYLSFGLGDLTFFTVILPYKMEANQGEDTQTFTKHYGDYCRIYLFLNYSTD